MSGSVTGDIIAATKVVLHKTARVCGNIQTGSLVVEDGAEIDGSIKMGKSAGLKAVDGGAAKAPAPAPEEAAERRFESLRAASRRLQPPRPRGLVSDAPTPRRQLLPRRYTTSCDRTRWLTWTPTSSPIRAESIAT